MAEPAAKSNQRQEKEITGICVTLQAKPPDPGHHVVIR
jgi:hypothetical protein